MEEGRILLIEDEESLNRGISFKLEKEGYQVYPARSIREGTLLFQNQTIDLIICDIGLPDGSGLDFLKQVRRQSKAHFLFLTAMDTEMDMVMGYELGADDYMTKPFSLSVLLSKVNVIFKRMHADYEEILKSGQIILRKSEMKVEVSGEEKNLTKNELRLLVKLMENAKQIMSRAQLTEALWEGEEDYLDENIIAVNIRRLREKIEKNPSSPEYIKNIRGMGYLWDRECQRS